jgi:crotonobetainyl-CoA:carnitine CoA-transferase CaiB-like acyl-CoA transferase
MTRETGALSHLRVLDLSRILAGPWATQMLGDLGADIIKVERPGTGDDTRGWGPPFVDAMTGDAASDAAARSAYFSSVNRNKRSLAIDITSPEGAAILRELIPHCDIVVENFKVGGLAKYGLDYDSLTAINPRLVYCSITGFGQHGPDSGRAGYDFMIQGMGGLMSVTGEPDGMPMKVGVALVDVLTGTNAAAAILAAVMHAGRTGTGQHIDMSLFDVSVASLANQALNYLVSDKVPGRLGNAHPNIVPYQAFATTDGHVILAVGNDSQFRKFCDVAGLDGLADDPDYATNKARVMNRTALLPHIEAAFPPTDNRMVAGPACRGQVCRQARSTLSTRFLPSRRRFIAGLACRLRTTSMAAFPAWQARFALAPHRHRPQRRRHALARTAAPCCGTFWRWMRHGSTG